MSSFAPSAATQSLQGQLLPLTPASAAYSMPIVAPNVTPLMAATHQPLVSSVQYNQAAHQTYFDAHLNGKSKSVREEPVVTSCRGIFIQNLSYRTTWQDLKGLLKKAGDVERCNIPLDKAERSRGFAVASYRTKDEAKKAVKAFDGVEFMGTRIKVRFDREGSDRSAERVGTPKSSSKYRKADPSQPLIVNGSRASMRIAASSAEESEDNGKRYRPFALSMTMLTLEDDIGHISRKTRGVRFG